MVLMALDHTRGFLSSARFAPVDLSQTTAPLFLTRWITHYCAPIFFLLAGTAAFLSLSRGRTLPQISRFFLTRGLWLVFLELTVVAVGWNFTLHVVPWTGGVIWALGWSMIIMAAIAWLPIPLIAAFGIALIGLHNMADSIQPETFGSLAWLWRALHSPDPHASAWLRVDYPIVPWVGVMAAGYSIGPLFQERQERRRVILMIAGGLMIVAFVSLRLANGYGDPQPWSPQRSGAYTFLSFLRVRKYPPSLIYLLMTLGPALFALALLENVRGRVAAFFITFGRVPLLFYVLHIYLAHALAVAIAYAEHGTVGFLLENNGAVPTYPDWYGVSLPVVYLAWLTVVAMLYPVCRAFAAVKASRRDWWLSYL
ncbi:MAG: hypothetical protein QOH22_757 [Gemmatimonadaceae bacterium]|jgi:uncharacterized membrane protein|nr:hypothetical protein [Gemmatimonadaceae bacterium]